MFWDIPVTCVSFVYMKFKLMLFEILSCWETSFLATLEAKENFLIVAGLVSQDVKFERLTTVKTLDAVRTLESFRRVSLTL